ncbi:MAG: hypothetical protein AAFQ68_27910, partial [Bacteroidota bacterium]
NKTYFAINEGGNQFAFSELTEAAQNGWSRYDFLVGDIDDDGADELVWNITHDNIINRTYTANLSADQQSIEFLPHEDLGTGWSQYDAYIGDMNGGGADLIFSRTDNINRLYVGKSNGDGSYTQGGPFTRAENGWGSYQTYVAQADNNPNVDMVLNYPGNGINRLYVTPSSNDSKFNSALPAQDHPVDQDWRAYELLLGDVDGDGIDDAIWTNHGIGDITSNVFTALGTSSGMYDFSPVKQSSPYQATWSQFQSFLLDINGDSKKDMLWIKAGSTTEIFVALAK